MWTEPNDARDGGGYMRSKAEWMPGAILGSKENPLAPGHVSKGGKETVR